MRMGGTSRDRLYAVLGVQPGASHTELKAAYRERAKKCHPDMNPGAAAAKEFRMLTEVRRACSPAPQHRRMPRTNVALTEHGA